MWLVLCVTFSFFCMIYFCVFSDPFLLLCVMSALVVLLNAGHCESVIYYGTEKLPGN